MRPLDALLLGSFPAPPTHIPATPTSPNPPPSRPPSSPLPPLPDDVLARARSFSFPLPRRTPSPDIAAIISATPRPQRRPSSPSDDDDDDARSWIDHDDFGRPLRYARLERQLGGSDSDSSLDLHTPLPYLMMRHGLLSPQSRLITQPSARDSVVSLASTTTSKGTHPLKDSRDTAKRRVRHRDGRLLRGGIGLTTGLGWSDSEDEGAPSALTRRISSLNLASRPSVSSLAPSRSTTSLSSAPSRSSSGASDLRASLPSRKSSSASSRPFSRSHSSSIIMSDFTQVDEFGKITSQKSPTTSKPRTPTTLSIRSRRSARAIPESEEIDSTNQYMDTFSRYTGGAAMSTTLPDMTLAELEAGEARHNKEKSLPPLPRSSILFDNGSMPPARSIGSTRSMGAMRMSSGSSTGANERRARSISGASSASRGSTGSTQSSSLIPPSSVRATITRVSTASQSTPDTGASMIKTPRLLRLTTPATTMPPHTPAPLLLAQRKQKHHDGPPVPVPAVISVDTHVPLPLLQSRSSLPSTPSTPSPVTPGIAERPRPRVGTGMTYRSSVSRTRVPSGIVPGPSPIAGMQKPIPGIVLGPSPTAGMQKPIPL